MMDMDDLRRVAFSMCLCIFQQFAGIACGALCIDNQNIANTGGISVRVHNGKALWNPLNSRRKQNFVEAIAGSFVCEIGKKQSQAYAGMITLQFADCARR